jgi:hypothetical protein
MESRRPPVPPEVEAAIKASVEGDPATAAYVLAAVANRAAAALHKLARETSEARKGQPDWGRWARLQNASRDAVLRTATSREIAGEIAGSARPPGQSTV